MWRRLWCRQVSSEPPTPEPWLAPCALVAGPDEEGVEEEEAQGEGDHEAETLHRLCPMSTP